jgi:hypothetical protein
MENNLPEAINEPSNKLLWILGSCSVLIVLFIIGLIFLQDHPKVLRTIPIVNSMVANNSNSNLFNMAIATVTPDIPKPDDAIAKVGNEYIYKKDMQTELQYAPPNTDKKNLLAKLVTDSIILQGAAEGNMITLSPKVFNSATKNYTERIKLVAGATKAVKNNSTKISGTIITMWFFNNDIPGTLGYDKGKIFALQKITALHNDVKSGRITIDQALDQVKHDDSLSQITTEHVNNAGFVFDSQTGRGPTSEVPFNKLIWNLKEGEISDIMPIHDPYSEKEKNIEVAYVFGQVKKKITNKNILNYDTWLQTKKNTYGVTYY